MQLVIGTYREGAYVPKTLEQIGKFVTGFDEIIFVDDSGSHSWRGWLSQFGRVVPVRGSGKGGYVEAMRKAVEVMEGEYACWWEEDFIPTEKIDLSLWAEHLDAHPYLAQVCAQRNPVWQNEFDNGGLFGDLRARGVVLTEVDGFVEQDYVFSCNPSVWRDVAFTHWTGGDGSEMIKTRELTEAGYRFAYTKDVVVEHSGVRSGFGY